ncbi:DUF748 domain-containing protein [Horticoccus luteus]|uniref:DUF748 domain-containing protein n=1 Tax=Horticoccus luteus TaxID=2862869 RepID=A0A8F9TVX7_9BACT|nr:DUF748 domain-containing protein [Horticoccus luteus]QYM80070.1 DUF748 domain-containing protein [Horticoccus luteus]
MKAPGRPKQKPAGRRHWLLTAGSVVVVIAGVLTLLSPLVTVIVNHKLHSLDGVEGRVGQVVIAWWRGGVTVHDFTLSSREQKDDPPLVKVKTAALRVAWEPLWHGKIGGAAVVDDAEFTTVKRESAEPKKEAGKKDEKMQAAKKKIQRWQDQLRHAFPVEVSRFELKNGLVHFIDRTHQPAVDVETKQVHLVVTGLGNRPADKEGPLPAKAKMTAVTTGDGAVTATLEIDPLAKQPRFKATFELKHMNLPPFNSFMLAYADADVSKGTFEVYMEINAQGGAYDGYVKPFFKDLDFSNPSDKDKSLGKRIKEKAIAAVSSLLKNDEDKKVATKAPFSGNFAQNDLDIWSTVMNLLHNAFVQALREGLEGQTPTKAK